MTENEFVVRNVDDLTAAPTRRAGIRERKLLSIDESIRQNVVLFDADAGAEVKPHRIRTSESIYVLAGRLAVAFDNQTTVLEAGTFCHFPPNTEHGLKCVQGPAQFLAIFAPPSGWLPSPEWLRGVYEEAWRQYQHEDNLGVKRTTLFLGTQAGLIALLALIASLLLGKDSSLTASLGMNLALSIFGITTGIVGVLAFVVAVVWWHAHKAGQAYVNLRWMSARAIEVASELDPWNVAGLEDEWRSESAKIRGGRVRLFPSHPILKKYEIPPKPTIGGWKPLQMLMIVLGVAWVFVAVGGFWLFSHYFR